MGAREQMRVPNGIGADGQVVTQIVEPDVKPAITCRDCEFFRRISGSESCGRFPPTPFLVPGPNGQPMVAGFTPPVRTFSAACGEYKKRTSVLAA